VYDRGQGSAENQAWPLETSVNLTDINANVAELKINSYNKKVENLLKWE